MEDERSLADQNSTFQSSSSSSSASLEDIEPEVQDQFVKLADALKETNQNLLTFEFMLAQYRKLARIEPFNSGKAENVPGHHHESELQKRLEHEVDKSDVLEQLRRLTLAVNNLQTTPSISEAENKAAGTGLTAKIFEDVHSIRGQLQELSDANAALAFLRSKVETLESNLEEKSRLVDVLTENRRRLTSQLNEEKERCLELDRKLESEKRAAAQVGKDITKYVEKMNDLESRIRISEPKVSDLEKRLSEKAVACDALSEENWKLKQKLEDEEKRRNVEMETNRNGDRSSFVQPDKNVSFYVEKIKELEKQVRDDYREKESLKTTIEILKDQLNESRQFNLNDSRQLNNTSSSSVCRSCIEGDRIEEAARKVQELAVDIQRRTDTDVTRLTSQNRELEATLRQEQNLRHSLETKVAVCENEIRSYESQVKEWKEELEQLHQELERCQQQQQFLQQPNDPSAPTTATAPECRFERREKRKLEKELKDLRLKLAEALAEKENLSCRQAKLIDELESSKEKRIKTEESLARLRSKSKVLLSNYRLKKQMYADLCVKVNHIKVCLVDLRDLCRIKDENYRDILDHVGSQVQISARLVAAYMDTVYNYDVITLSGSTLKLSNWFCAIQALSTWTHKQLMTYARNCWAESKSRKDVDCDTLSEISHTFEQDSERERSVLSLAEAQDRISRTQTDSFENLLSRIKID